MQQHKTHVAAAVLTLIVMSGTMVPGQQTGREQGGAFRSGVELVTVDVGVVDRQGHPVTGLGPGDFVVTVGGQQRRVVSAEFVNAAAALARAAAEPDAVPISTNEGAGGGRLFVFIVDQSTLEPGSTRHVANGAAQFLDHLTFADRSALMFMPIGPHVGFTWVHDRVRSALQRATGLWSAAGGWEFGSLTEARDIANRNTFALQTVGQRECGSSIMASGAASGGGGGGGGGGAAGGTAGGGQPPPAGGGAPAGGSGGGGAAPPGGTSSAGGGGTAGALGGDRCLREVQMMAESTWRTAQMTSLSSMSSLRQMLGTLERVQGDKTVILISGGWPLDQLEQTSLLATVAEDAAKARATFFTIFVPRSTFSASRRLMSTTSAMDQHIHSWALETLATMTGGGSFRAEVSADAAFDRLSRELAGYYRIGVERDPSDQDGRARRMKVEVSRGATVVRAREIFDVRTYEDRNWAARLSSALEAPIPATGVGIRVTSYVAADPEDRARIKLVLTGEASRLQPGEATFQILLHDLQGNRVLTGEQPFGTAVGDTLPFASSIPVAPGSYIVRVAVMDASGRVGSVEHRVEAHQVPVGSLSVTGPLLVRVPTRGHGESRLALDGLASDERLALEIGFEEDSAGASGTEVVFEITGSADGAALVKVPAVLARGPRDGSMIAQGIADTRILPPGRYLARAKLTSGNDAIGEVRRAFSITGPPPAPAGEEIASAAPGGRVTSSPHAVRALTAVPHFTVDQVLAPQVLGAFLDGLAARPDAGAPQVRELLARARTSGIQGLAVSESLAAEAPIAAFLKGLTLLAENRLNPAADAFRSAMRASPDFSVAMVYLGACYAAAGKDKEAAGAWRTALIREGNSVAVHVLAADAFLRQGRGDLALHTIEQARAKWPEDDELTRRFVVAALVADEHARGLEAVDDLVERRADDEPTLALALMVLYESFVSGQPVVSAEDDRARMLRLADAYRARGGPSLALVETWVAAAAAKR